MSIDRNFDPCVRGPRTTALDSQRKGPPIWPAPFAGSITHRYTHLFGVQLCGHLFTRKPREMNRALDAEAFFRNVCTGSGAKQES